MIAQSVALSALQTPQIHHRDHGGSRSESNNITSADQYNAD